MPEARLLKQAEGRMLTCTIRGDKRRGHDVRGTPANAGKDSPGGRMDIGGGIAMSA